MIPRLLRLGRRPTRERDEAGVLDSGGPRLRPRVRHARSRTVGKPHSRRLESTRPESSTIKSQARDNCPHPAADPSPCFRWGQRLPPLAMGFRLDKIDLDRFAGARDGVAAAALPPAAGSGRKMLDPDDDARTGYEKALLDFRRGDCLSAEPMFPRDPSRVPLQPFRCAGGSSASAIVSSKTKRIRKRSRPIGSSSASVPRTRRFPTRDFESPRPITNQIPGGWFMTPPAAERDQSAARDALIQLRRFVVDYPEDQRVPDAHQAHGRMHGPCSLRTRLYVARFYLKRDAYRGVISRLKGLIASYPGSASGGPRRCSCSVRSYLKNATKSRRPGRRLNEIVQRFPGQRRGQEGPDPAREDRLRRRARISGHRSRPIATFGSMAPWAQQILDAANEHYDRAEYPLAQPYYEKPRATGAPLSRRVQSTRGHLSPKWPAPRSALVFSSRRSRSTLAIWKRRSTSR